MSKMLVDSIASSVNTGVALQVIEKVSPPSDVVLDDYLKIVLSVIVGLISPLLNDLVRSYVSKKRKQREMKIYYRKGLK